MVIELFYLCFELSRVVTHTLYHHSSLSTYQFALEYSPPPPVLRFELDRGVPLEPQNRYPSVRVILAEKGAHF